MTTTTQAVTQQDRDALERVDDALGWLTDGEHEILLAAFAAYRLAIIEQCAGVLEEHRTAYEKRAMDESLPRKERTRCSHYVQALDKIEYAIRSTAAKGG